MDSVTVPSRVKLVDGRSGTLVGILPRNTGRLEEASFGIRIDSVKHLGIAFMGYRDIDFEGKQPIKKVVKKKVPVKTSPTPAPNDLVKSKFVKTSPKKKVVKKVFKKKR